jgi:hypothetical protein
MGRASSCLTASLEGIEVDRPRRQDACDLLPNLPSFIRRVCSSFAPHWVRTRFGVSPLRLECGRWVL